VTLAKALDSAVVAEGVASNDDLLHLETMGVDFAQANLLCPAITLKKLLATGYLDDLAHNSQAGPKAQPQKVHDFDQHRAVLRMAAGDSFYT
jgi:EAL domain-containing protein (putative c-di-GMP-specific phosphodiesterase class I)